MSDHEIAQHPSCSQLRPRWQKRLLLGSLIVVPLCLAAPFVYLIVFSNRELREAITEADRLDPGWHVQELVEKRAVIPDGQNSALVIVAAQGLVPANCPFWDFPGAPENLSASQQGFQISKEALWTLEPPVQLDEHQTKALRAELRRAGDALASLRKVGNLPRGRYPNQMNAPLFTLQISRLLAYDVLLRTQDEDVDSALTSCRALLNCGRSFGDEPGLMAMLVRLALTRMAISKVERTLAQGEPSEAALSSIQHELEEEAQQPLLLIAARGERAGNDEMMQAVQNGELDPKSLLGGPGSSPLPLQLLHVPGMIRSTRTALLKSNNRLVEIAKLPVEQQIVNIKELGAGDEQNLPIFGVLLAYARIQKDAAARFHRDQTELRCAVVMVAVERYRRENGRWPDALTDLVPAYLSIVPLDPFDGKPLRYRRLADGVVIYSVGPDGIDNGGKLDYDFSKAGAAPGMRLWDVLQRRQLPKARDKVPKDQDD